MVGKVITDVILRREGLRFPFPLDFVRKVIGTRVDSIRRRAKYLLIDLDDGRIILSHLGMSGRYTLFEASKVRAYSYASEDASRFGSATGFDGRHDHVEFQFDDGSVAVYTDPRRFGIMDLIDTGEEEIHSLLEHLGPEPLSNWDANQLAKALENKSTNIKVALLDQRVVVGVGNIYA